MVVRGANSLKGPGKIHVYLNSSKFTVLFCQRIPYNQFVLINFAMFKILNYPLDLLIKSFVAVNKKRRRSARVVSCTAIFK